MRRIVTTPLVVLRRSAQPAWDSWRRFWFEPADPLPLGVIRILVGGMLIYTHVIWGQDLEGFLGPDGWQSAELVRSIQRGQWSWSFWWWVPHRFFGAAHVAALVILLFNFVGAFTPVTSVLAYLITISYASRAPIANYGLDQVNGIASLYLAIGQSGQCLSLDRLYRRYRDEGARAGGATGAASDCVVPSARANLALRLMQVHLCVIYIFACLSKLQGESWWSGLAIWQAAANLEYQSRDLTWLAWYPWLVNLLTHVTIVWEMSFWALVWKPLCRPIVLLTGTVIHLGIGAFLGMWTFGLAVVFMYVAFIPATTLRRALHAVQRFVAAPARLAGIRPATIGDSRPPVPGPPVGVGNASPAFFSGSERPADAPGQAASKARPHKRPIVLLLETRLKRQTQIQEYFLKRGFQCLVASEPDQARRLLAVTNIDALLVTSRWYPGDEIAAFRESLMAGGASLPPSVFLSHASHAATVPDVRPAGRHRVLSCRVSMRDLKLCLLEVLGLDEKDVPRHSAPRSPRKPRPPAPTESSVDLVQESTGFAAELSARSGEEEDEP